MSLVSLYDEASLWMTPSGAKDGRLFSELPVPVYGPELVRNGGFDSGTGWSTPSGWSISNGTLQGTNVAAVSATQAGITFLNKSFRVEYTITEISQGDVRIYLGGTQSTPNRNAVGTYVEYIDITTANTTLYIQGINNFTGKIDNISVKEVLVADGDFTFSRGSNLAATRVGPTGLIEKGRENLAYNSDWSGVSTDTNPTGWTQFLAGTGTFNATGTSGQIRLQTSDASSRVIIYSNTIGTNGILAVSAYVDAVATTIQLSNLISRSATSTQLLAFEDGVEISYSDNIKAGKRYLVIFNQSAPTEYRFGVGTSSSVLGDVTISRPQIEQGLVATEYIPSPVGSTGKAGLLEDEPRLDYSGGATCPSLLLEPSRSNLFTQSEYFNSSDWIKSNVTATDNYAISPDGLQNATLINDGTAAVTQHWFYQSITLSSGTTYTISFYAKYVDRKNMFINIYDGATSNFVYYDIQNGVVLNANGNAVRDIVDVGSGWYRITYTRTIVGSGANFRIGMASDTPLQTYTGENKEALIYGLQAEVGSYPTSYIPNHSGGSVTRSRDQADNSSLNPILGNGNISVMYDFIYDVVGREGSGQIFLLYSGNNSLGIKGTQPTDRRLQLFSYGDFSGTIGFNEDVPYQTRHKVVFRVTGEVVELFYNGVKQNNTIDASALGGVYNWSRIKLDPTNAILAGLNQLAVFPTALTDSECIKLTTL